MTIGIEAAPPAAPARLRELDELPSPPGWPLVGNALQMERPRMHQQVERWSREYGPYFTFRLGTRRLLVVADHAALGAVLRDRPEGFRRTKRLAEITGEIGSSAVGVFGSEGEAWKRQRRMVMAGFDPRHLRAYFSSLIKVSERLAGRWGRAADAGAPIDLQADLMRYTVDTVSGLAFGADVNTLESDDDVIQRHLDKIFPAIFRRIMSPLPTWRYWKTAADRELDESVAAIGVAIANFVAAARRRLEDPARRAAPQNLLEAMIVAADDPQSGITPNEINGNVLTMLLAGEDTTANTLAWAIWLLSRHPGCLESARAEVDAEVGEPAAWTIERFGKLDYVEACANETMRLRPVAPFVMLQALRDTSIADIRVPAETVIWAALRADCLREAHFDGAERFDPGRWLADAGPSASSANRVSMPFGAGPRVCPGRHLAMLEIKMALAVLLGRFDIESVAPTRTGAPADEPAEELAFSMAPEPLTLRLRRRAGAR
ncbi:MAG: cytochrome P450 [Rhizobacter sp.]|nr:cytochrome P450 [Rhizobacter sp.]